MCVATLPSPVLISLDSVGGDTGQPTAEHAPQRARFACAYETAHGTEDRWIRTCLFTSVRLLALIVLVEPSYANLPVVQRSPRYPHGP